MIKSLKNNKLPWADWIEFMEIRKELLRHLGLGTFTVVDLETTGLDPEKDQIIEIGAIKYIDGVEAESFEQLINPGRPIPEFITRLTGISDDDVADKPKIEEIFPRLDTFLGGSAFVGQQVNFDASFIEYEYRKQNNDFQFWEDRVRRFKYLDNLRLDTLFIARIFLPFLRQFKLASLADYFGYDLTNAHRAVEDARATGHVFVNLVDRALAVDNSALINIINLLYPNSRRAKTFFVPVLNFKKINNIAASKDSLLDDARQAQQYYNIIGEKEYSFESPDDEPQLSPVFQSEVEAYFSETGRLASLIETYEFREAQLNMAAEISRGFNDGAFVISEAGTGTGKSMAYLVPAVQWAIKNRKANQRVVISTNTKNLQEQLFYKDIPMLYSAAKGGFKAVLLKGRANYLCLEKWHTVMSDLNQRLSQDERSRLLPLVLWVQQTRTGDIAENAAFQLERNFGLWQKFIAEPSYCPGRSCKYYKECYLMKAREHARHADLVVVNHSLLFSDLAADHSILDEYQNLILDEAHNIEKSASEYLGVRVSYWSFRNIYHKLYEEESKRSGNLQQLDLRMNQGRLSDEDKKQIGRQAQKVKRQSTALKEKVQIFYNDLNRVLRERYMNSGAEENRVRYFKGFKFFKNLSDETERLKKALKELTSGLDRLITLLNGLDPEQFEFQEQLLRELIALQADAEALLEDFEFCLLGEAENYVFWLDIPRNERNNDIVLHGVPLNIAELLKNRLFERLHTTVFSSATIAVNGTFNYFESRTGLNLLEKKSVYSSVLGSPFNFAEQAGMGVLDFMPDPRNNDFTEALAAVIKDVYSKHQTGMLVLFTSYGLLNKMYEMLKPYFDGERKLLLAQGKSGSRTNLIFQFKEFKDSVLFGTDSFWEGIDVPGEALEILLIPKLPFDVPTEPVIAARMDEIKKRGGNAFFEYSVPEAVIKFRQGFGRLLRNKSDRGIVLVGDNRLSRMQYGKQFINSMPVDTKIYKSKDDMLDDIGTFFKK